MHRGDAPPECGGFEVPPERLDIGQFRHAEALRQDRAGSLFNGALRPLVTRLVPLDDRQRRSTRTMSEPQVRIVRGEAADSAELEQGQEWASLKLIMARTLRLFMLVEAATFIVAASIHAGLLIAGYEHREARIAETVIAVVLLAGATLTWIRPTSARAAGLAAQSFALFGTLVGIFTIAIGIGPRSALDIVYHIAIVAVLVWGVLVAWRARMPA